VNVIKRRFSPWRGCETAASRRVTIIIRAIETTVAKRINAGNRRHERIYPDARRWRRRPMLTRDAIASSNKMMTQLIAYKLAMEFRSTGQIFALYEEL
jgi:hypothetical protein